jgi:hypothetical protein
VCATPLAERFLRPAIVRRRRVETEIGVALEKNAAISVLEGVEGRRCAWNVPNAFAPVTLRGTVYKRGADG